MTGHFSVSYLLAIFPSSQRYFPTIRYHPAATGSCHMAPFFMSACQRAAAPLPAPVNTETKSLTSSTAGSSQAPRDSELIYSLSVKLKERGDRRLGFCWEIYFKERAQRALKQKVKQTLPGSWSCFETVGILRSGWNKDYLLFAWVSCLQLNRFISSTWASTEHINSKREVQISLWKTWPLPHVCDSIILFLKLKAQFTGKKKQHIFPFIRALATKPFLNRSWLMKKFQSKKTTPSRGYLFIRWWVHTWGFLGLSW